METKTIKNKSTEIPHISLIIPTHKKYPHFKSDKLTLKRMIEEAESRISGILDKKTANEITASLDNLRSKIDFEKLREGLVIHYSPKGEKIYHLPFNPVEKLIIDHSFEIRDLLYSLKMKNEYLILVLSENGVKAGKVKDGHYEEFDIEEMPLGKNDTGGPGSSRTRSFSSSNNTVHATDRKAFDEKKIEKYLMDIDSILSNNSKLQKLHVMVFTPVRLVGKFNKITHNSDRILGYIKGSYEKKTNNEILIAAEKFLKTVDEKRQTRVLALIEKENKRKRLSWGIRDVNRSANENRGHLLVLEKDFMKASVNAKDFGIKNSAVDVVDDIIEKVLEQGGDVEFVDNGRLGAYGKIVMICRY